VYGGKTAILGVAVGVGGNDQDTGLVFGEHGRRIGIDRDLPTIREKAAAFLIGVRPGNKAAIGVGGDCPGVGTGLLPAFIIFQKACDAAQTDNRYGDFFHK
jgi:hypothetical protein